MDFKLFNAILSMDAYNRGYGAKIELSSANGTEIGNVTISATSADLPTNHENIGFYGIAYQIKDGQGNVIETIISYRGTDSYDLGPVTQFFLPDDVHHGWSLGLGNLDSEQGEMARA